MTAIFLKMLTSSAIIGLITVLLIALTPLLNKRCAAKWKYWIWFFLAVRLLLPVNLADLCTVFQPLSQGRTQQTAQTQQHSTQAPPSGTLRLERVTVEIPPQMTTPITVHTKKSGFQVTPLTIIGMLWAAGALCFFGIHFISYVRYKRRLLKTGTRMEDSSFARQLQELRQELAISRSVSAIESPEAASPMIIGFWGPVLVLPKEQYSAEERYFILKHELVHLKRGDVYFKLLLVAANAVHWFNPLIWLMQKEAAVDMELSCDERVTKDADYAQRKAYAETLWSTLHRQYAKQTVLSTQFYGGKKVMKKRFQNILRKTAGKSGAAMLFLVILFTISMGTLIGCSAADKTAAETQNRTDTQEELVTDTPPLETASMDTDIPDIVLDEAQAWTIEEYEYCKRFSPGSHYIDWRIESLEHCYTYEDFQSSVLQQYWEDIGPLKEECEDFHDMVLQIYRMNIEFLSEQPESVFLAGGMTMTEDGWVVPDYPNSRYLVFQQDGEELTLLTRMFENDCEAGDDTFTKDLEHNLMLNELPVPTMTFSQEGETNTVPAELMDGDGYTYYVPAGEWYPSDFENWEDVDENWKARIYDAWTAWNNEDVRFWIARMEGESYDEAQKELLDEGYAVIDDRMLRQDGDTIYSVELKEAQNDTWGIFARYPVDAQEGYGMQIHAIADTFTVSK